MGSESHPIEKDIVERITRAKIRLRFDKVVQRIVGGLQAALRDIILDGEAVIFTVTAPIRLPAKTVTALANLIRNGAGNGDRREAIHGNQVRIRRLTGVPPRMPKVLGFVHNHEADAGLILDLAEKRLLGRDEPP